MSLSPLAGNLCRLPLAAALLAAASSANALIIEDSLVIGGLATTGTAPSTFNQSGTVSVNGGARSRSNLGEASASAFANSSGRYFARANTRDTGSGDSQVQWSRTITNDRDVAQALTLDVYLYGGALSTFDATDATSYAWDISFTNGQNTVSLFNSDVSLVGDEVQDADSDGLGTLAGTFAGGATYRWDARQLSDLALGTLNVGDSLTIDYTLSVAAMSATVDPSCSIRDDIDEVFNQEVRAFRVQLVDEVSVPCSPGASAFTGDPSNLNANASLPPFASAAINAMPTDDDGGPVAVSEPALLPLAALAIFGAVGGFRRASRRA